MCKERKKRRRRRRSSGRENGRRKVRCGWRKRRERAREPCLLSLFLLLGPYTLVEEVEHPEKKKTKAVARKR